MGFSYRNSFRIQQFLTTRVGLFLLISPIFSTSAVATVAPNLPIAQLNTDINVYNVFNGTSFDDPQTSDGSHDLIQSYGLRTVSTPSGQAFVTTALEPRMTASATGNNAGSISTSASFNYSVSIISPYTNDLTEVPIDFLANLSATSSYTPYSDSNFSISRTFFGVYGDTQSTFEALSCPNRCALDSGLTSSAFASGGTANEAVTGSISTEVSSQLTVIEAVSAEAGGSGSASGAADPFFFIDSNFAAAHPGYSLTFSQNVGNSPLSAVPEPATWAMIIGGLGLAGVAMRARSRDRLRNRITG